MNKAFLFDMDGVLVNSEQVWEECGRSFEENIFGKEILGKIGDATGTSLTRFYDLAVALGFTEKKEDVIAKYDDFMGSIYEKSTVTPGLEDLLSFLKGHHFHIGIVSSSRKGWIEMVLKGIPYRDMFDLTISLDEENLPSKPDPAGYLLAMKTFGVGADTTFVLEDSNAGITSGKSAGAFTIAFTPLVVNGYQQIAADKKANSFEEVIEIVKEKLQ